MYHNAPAYVRIARRMPRPHNAWARPYSPVDNGGLLPYGSTLAAIKQRGKQVPMQTYAVIETGGKQYLVKEGTVLDVEKIPGAESQSIELDRVLAVSNGEQLKIGTPVVAGARVTAEVVKAFRGKKVIVFKKKRRKGYHKKAGHRQSLLRIRITRISA